jgi:spermidine synthase
MLMDSSKWRTGVLLALFVGSGCSALIYEICWLQQLGLVLGATSVSLSILLTSFMGGMCFGSLALPRLVSPERHPLRVYAVLELLIGACGLAILWAMPLVSQVYCWVAWPGSGDLAARAVVALTLLLPPTFLMGATLPAVARWVKATQSGLSDLGFFYGANTLGAVVGSLLAGLWLLPFFDVVVATCVAAAINISVAVSAWLLARRNTASHRPSGMRQDSRSESSPHESSPHEVVGEQPSFRARQFASASYLVVGFSGMTALGAEVVWTRWLGLLFGPTTYTFSILLAVFLSGLGIGSWGGAWLARRMRRPGHVLAVTQLLLVAAIPFGAFMIVDVLPYWLHARDATQPLWVRMSLDLVRALAAFLPATILWGASFPLAVAAVGEEGRDSARLVGGLYAANTLGAIAGTVLVSLVAVPLVDGRFAQQLLTIVAGLSGIVMLIASAQRMGWQGVMKLVGGCVACGVAVFFVPAVPKGLLAYGRTVERWPTTREYFFVGEGLDSPVVVSESAEGFRCFHVAGKVEATNSPTDMRTQRLLGHLPAMVHPKPRSVLVIGCGSGMTTGTFLLHPSVERIVLCEMEPNVIHTARQFFASENGGVLDNPKLEIVIDDARHFLATTKETFDIITADPIHPWVRGAASLYTAEFYKLCRSRLTPQGVVTQWVPLYESNPAAVKCELATFLQVFPRASLWSGQNLATGYDLVVVATIGDQEISPRTLSGRMRTNPALQRSLREIGLPNAEALLSRFAVDGSILNEWLSDAQINRDRNLRLQYLAGLTPESQTAQEIFQAMVSRRRPIGWLAN